MDTAMPYSADEGKSWAVEKIVGLDPTHILDVGPGAGSWAKLLRPRLPDAWLYGIEVYKPYVRRFELVNLYDKITVADVRGWEWPRTYDVVILGDVLEHMTYEEARSVWREARANSAHQIVSIPIGERYWHQGPEGDNEHEAHLYQWGFEEFADMPGVVHAWKGEDVGVFLSEGT